MPSLEKTDRYLDSEKGRADFASLYGSASDTLEDQRNRYRALIKKFASAFTESREVSIFSAPGRTEVGGNHTDHNGGRVLAAAVDMDAIALAARNETGLVRVRSAGYPTIRLRVDELDPFEGEKYTSTALIRGVLARFQQLGLAIGGFDAVVESRVPKGSGLSSSASYEILIATMLNHLYNGGQVDPVLLAQIGQFAENEYFGKPCGLMDQTTSSVGGFVTIDFKDFKYPVVKKLNFDFDSSGYALVIVDTWGNHARLSDDYAAIENEMKSVANALGGNVLREFSEEMVLENIPALRKQVSDRAILRAIHFFRDDLRVVKQVQALEAGDFSSFLRLVNESGRSSWMLLQNCYTPKAVQEQGIPIALTASQAILGEQGAWRVHGGGFAGTIQAFVPVEQLTEYIRKLDHIMGAGSCHPIRIRPDGAVCMPVES